MSTSFPDPNSLIASLNQLLGDLNGFEEGLTDTVYTKSSSDGLVTVKVDGTGTVVQLDLDPSQLTIGADVLAEKVKDVANEALSEAQSASAALMGSFASGLALPGLPPQGSTPPPFAGFAARAAGLSSQFLANSPCDSSKTFECTKGPVTVVTNAKREIVSLVIATPLSKSATHLASRLREAINCAEEKSGDGGEETDEGTTEIINKSNPINDVCVYANGSLEVGYKAKVKKLESEDYGTLGNAGTGETTIRGHADIGKIYSVADVTVAEYAEVHGLVDTVGSLTASSSSTVDGPVTEGAILAIPELSFHVVFPATTIGTIVLGPSASQTAAPGYYQKLWVANSANVYLSSGVYYFDEFFFDAGAKIWLDVSAGPVIIWVKNSFFFKGSFVDPAGELPRVFVGYLGTSTAYVKSFFVGSLAAPDAKIKIYSPGFGFHIGTFHGQHIDIKPYVVIKCRQFEIGFGDLPGLTPVDPGPELPVVDLGFEKLSGWSSPQMTLVLASSPATEGVRSLQINNAVGLTEINSADFSTDEFPTDTTRLLVDLWVPSAQPNPTYFGAMSVIVSIPSAGITSLNLGSLGLTSLAQNQFNTLEFPIPTALQDAFNTSWDDVSLSLVLDINTDSGPWYLDDIRGAITEPDPIALLDGILSFEDITKWSSPQGSIDLVSDPKTHLERALRLANAPGWTQVISVPFSTESLSAPAGRFLCELWIPSNQPNPDWHGQFQLHMEMPSQEVFNEWVGQVDLTTLPKDTFTTMVINMPPVFAALVNENHPDLILKLVLNVTSGSGPHYLDQIRFE